MHFSTNLKKFELMARPLRIQFHDAYYHVTSRGDRREAIFEDDLDRVSFLKIVGRTFERLHVHALAYCLMDNHYHLVLCTPRANLAAAMRQINSSYTQAYNRRHEKIGHLFQGRYKSILIEEDAYLMEVCRYVDLNPIRAGIIADPKAWPWSSYSCHIGATASPDWLHSEKLLQQFAHDLSGHPDCDQSAATRYAQFVAQGHHVRIWEFIKDEVFLGSPQFVTKMKASASDAQRQSIEIPRVQCSDLAHDISWYLEQSATREQGFYSAHYEGGHSMTNIAKLAGVSISRVRRIVAAEEARRSKEK